MRSVTNAYGPVHELGIAQTINEEIRDVSAGNFKCEAPFSGWNIYPVLTVGCLFMNALGRAIVQSNPLSRTTALGVDDLKTLDAATGRT